MTFTPLPAEVPSGLTEREYAKLVLRYSLVPKFRQCLDAQRYSAAIADSGQGNMTEDQRKALTIALGLLSTLMQAQEIVTGAKGWIYDRLWDGAVIADAKLDQIDSIKQPKRNIQGFLAEAAKKAVQTFDNVVENMLLPTLGLPLNGLPNLRTGDEYYSAGKKYIFAGLHSSAAACYQKAMEVDAGSPAARAASVALRTDIPTKKAPIEAEKKLMRVKELFVISNFKAATEACREGIQLFPNHAPLYVQLANMLIPDAELEEPDRLIDTALRLFPEYADALIARARIDAIGLRLHTARAAIEKLQLLDPDHRNAKSYAQTLDLLQSL